MEQEVEALKRLLEENGIEYKITTHERVYTSEEAAKISGVPLRSGVKAMIVKAESGFFLVLVHGNKDCSITYIHISLISKMAFSFERTLVIEDIFSAGTI